jgi:hypothetical protein
MNDGSRHPSPQQHRLGVLATEFEKKSKSQLTRLSIGGKN